MPTPTQSPATQNEPVAQSPIIIPDPLENPNLVLIHPKVTRFRVRTNRLTKHLNLHVSSVSPLPKSYRDAFSDLNWQNAMRDEYHALIKNKTWILVRRPPDTNIVCCMWLFRHKYLVDGTLSRYKARLVTNDSTQLEGVDVDETFSPVVKPETEYRGVVNAVAETCWLRNLLRELHTPLSSATLVYCDNVNAVYLSCNPVQHQRTKHIEIDIHFVRDLVAVGQVRVLHVPSRYQFEDISTNGLPSALFEEFRSSLSVCCPSAATSRRWGGGR
ncbi:ribonuclease H-like domain-containing protein [Tanacetum coccineum]